MSTLQTLRKLVLGDTWIVPLGVLLTVAGGVLLREVAPGVWGAAGPVLLPAVVLVVLAVGVITSLPPQHLVVRAARKTRRGRRS